MRRTIPVTVVIPAYNAAKFVRAAVETVRAQSVNVEDIVVVDDGSTDDTASLAEKLGVRVLRARHGGPGATRNAGLAVVRSEWIATLDADDLWHPRKLELQYDAVVAQPQLGLVFTDFDAVAVTDGRIHKSDVVSDHRSFMKMKRRSLTPQAGLIDFEDLLRELPARSIVLPSTTLFRRELALEIGGFSTDIKAEDAEFFLRLASCTRTAFVALPLVAYMRHSSQITANWELDPVRIELYHHIMANEKRYHEFVVRGYKKQYANLLYYSAANAANKGQIGTSLKLLGKAIAIAAVRRQLPALSGAVARSRTLRSRLRGALGRKASAFASYADNGIVREVMIPWRMRSA